MEKIKIVTDSTSDLDTFYIKKYDIEVLPLLVTFGEETFRDKVNINVHDMLKKIKDSGVFPKTSQVNPQSFYECYKKYVDEGYKILSIHISSKVSGTYQSASIAKEMLDTKDIVIIDSMNISSGLGILVLKAAQLLKNGISLKETEEKIKEAIPHVKSVIEFNSFDNLVKGGRLSKTVGMVGNVLDIKPIISVVDGEVTAINKVRGSKKALRTIVEYLAKHEIKEGEPLMLIQLESTEVIEGLKNELSVKKIPVIENEVGCVVGVHSGSNACGIFFLENY